MTGMVVMGLAAGYINPDVARSAITLAEGDRDGMAAGLTSTMRQVRFGVGVLALGRLGQDSPTAVDALSPVFLAAALISAAAAIAVLCISSLGDVGSIERAS